MPPTLPTKGDLTPEQQIALAECERIIEAGLSASMEVWVALQKVSDERLYRATHSTFNQYVTDKYKMTANYAYRLISAADVVKELLPMGNTAVTEREARELVKAPAGTRLEVLNAATKAAPNGKRTAKHIKDAVEIVKGKSEPKPPTLESQFKDATKGLSLDNIKSPLANLIEAQKALAANALRDLTTVDDMDAFLTAVNQTAEQLFDKLEEMKKV